MTDLEYRQNIDKLKKFSYHYYVLDDPIVSDDEYDKLYLKIVEYELKNPLFIDSSSPTRRVGDIGSL